MAAIDTDRPDAISEDEAVLRRDLAACYRLMAWFGWDDLLATHLSARCPGQDDYLVNPFGLLFEEMTASGLVKVNRDGEVVGPMPHGVNRAAIVIHGAVYETRPDAGCVIHLHTPDGAAVSAIEDGLLPLNQKAMSVWQDVAYHDYEGVAFDVGERRSLQRDLGDKNLMLLRNHGTLAVGTSVAEAFWRMYALEWSCTVQVRTLAMGRELHWAPPEVVARVDEQLPPELMAAFHHEALWPAMLRKLDRVNPGYEL